LRRNGGQLKKIYVNPMIYYLDINQEQKPIHLLFKYLVLPFET